MWSRGRKGYKGELIQDVVGKFNAVQRVAGSTGVTIKQVEGCTQPMTCLRTKVVELEPLSPKWPASRIRKWEGEAYHEVGHHAPEVLDTLPFMTKHCIGFDCVLGRLINVIDDVRNERNKHGYYVGRDESLSYTQAFYCLDGVRRIQEAIDAKQELNANAKLFRDVLSWVYIERAKWQPDLAIPSNDFAEVSEPSKYNVLSSDLNSMSTIEEVHSIALRILDISEDHTPEEEQEKAKKAAKGEGKPEDGKL
jgi:hypothetical protein